VNWKALAAFAALLIALVATVALLMLVQRPDTMTFFFTGDTEGYLVPCGCRTVPAGGLARRAALLAGLRRNPSAGAVQPVEITHGFADRGPGRAILNRALGRFFKREGYLVGVGSYDALLGLDELKKDAPGVPLLGAGQQGLEGSAEFRLGGWGAGVIGDRGSRLRVVFVAQTAPGGSPVPDPVESLREEIARRPAEGYIVAGQFAPRYVPELIKVSQKLVAIFGVWRTEVTSAPQKVGETWVVYLGDRGRRCAEFRLSSRGSQWTGFPSVEYLGPDLKSDPAVENEAKGVLQEVSSVNAAALEKAAKPAAPGKAYIGSAACAKCHEAALTKWGSTYHPLATKDLAIDHQEQNPDCLICHSTGLGEPGGYPQKGLDLSGVQCEACHGPGEGHPPAKLGTAPASEETCGKCHGLRDSPQFKLPGFWEAIKHP